MFTFIKESIKKGIRWLLAKEPINRFAFKVMNRIMDKERYVACDINISGIIREGTFQPVDFDQYGIYDTTISGIIREGTFQPVDFDQYQLVDTYKNLVLEKGKYKIYLRDKNSPPCYSPVGMLVADNTSESYNEFWGNDSITHQYLDESRIKFYEDVCQICAEYLQGRIIDIGSGSGDFLLILSQKFSDYEFFGTDFSYSSIKRCKTLVPEGGFAVSDIYKLGFKSNTFNSVICMEVFEHLDNFQAAFVEARRICKPNGNIIITIPEGKYDNYIGHLNFWSKDEFMSLLGDVELVDYQSLENGRSMLFVIRN